MVKQNNNIAIAFPQDGPANRSFLQYLLKYKLHFSMIYVININGQDDYARLLSKSKHVSVINVPILPKIVGLASRVRALQPIIASSIYNVLNFRITNMTRPTFIFDNSSYHYLPSLFKKHFPCSVTACISEMKWEQKKGGKFFANVHLFGRADKTSVKALFDSNESRMLADSDLVISFEPQVAEFCKKLYGKTASLIDIHSSYGLMDTKGSAFNTSSEKNILFDMAQGNYADEQAIFRTISYILDKQQEVTFTLIGDFDLTNLQQVPIENRLRINFIGIISEKDRRYIYNNAALIVNLHQTRMDRICYPEFINKAEPFIFTHEELAKSSHLPEIFIGIPKKYFSSEINTRTEILKKLISSVL